MAMPLVNDGRCSEGKGKLIVVPNKEKTHFSKIVKKKTRTHNNFTNHTTEMFLQNHTN